MILAESAMHRKAQPVSLAVKLCRKINNTKIISGRSSVQGVADELCRTGNDSKGIMKSGGSAIFFAPEFAAALVQDRSAIDILTDWYDYHEEYPITLRGRENVVAKEIVFSILAASNINMLDEMFGQAATYGGLLGRIFVVKPDERRPGNSLIDSEPVDGEIQVLVKELEAISKLKGKMGFTPSAKKAFNEWYKGFREASFVKRDKIGVLGRVHTGILKLAIIKTAAAMSLEIGRDAIEASIEECISLIPNYKEFIGKSGTSVDAKVASLLIEDLASAPKYTITRREFLGRHWEDVSVETLESAIIKFEAAGFIQTLHDSGIITFRLTQLCIAEMEIK